MKKKFKFTGETMTTFLGKTLHRIRAIADIIDAVGDVIVKAGQLGGWIEKEENLSQDGNAWVYGNASVYGNALVCDDARIYGNASVYGNAHIYGNASIYGNALVCDDARIYGNASVYGNLRVCDDASIYGNARVYGNASVHGNARVCDDAVMKNPDHYLTVGPIGSRNDTTTFFRNAKGIIKVKCGCFIGTIDEFLEKVTETHSNNKHAVVYRAAAALAVAQIDTTVTYDDISITK